MELLSILQDFQFNFNKYKKLEIIFDEVKKPKNIISYKLGRK